MQVLRTKSDEGTAALHSDLQGKCGAGSERSHSLYFFWFVAYPAVEASNWLVDVTS